MLIFFVPQRAAHNISELNLFLYFRISGVSDVISACDVGVTFTLTCDSRRPLEVPAAFVPLEPAPNPNVRKDLCFCCNG